MDFQQYMETTNLALRTSLVVFISLSAENSKFSEKSSNPVPFWSSLNDNGIFLMVIDFLLPFWKGFVLRALLVGFGCELAIENGMRKTFLKKFKPKVRFVSNIVGAGAMCSLRTHCLRILVHFGQDNCTLE